MSREPITDTSTLGMVELTLHHMLNERGVTEYARARYGPTVATLELTTVSDWDGDGGIYWYITNEVARDGAGTPIDFDLSTEEWVAVLSGDIEWDDTDPFPPTFAILHEDLYGDDVESEWNDLRWDEGWFTLSEDFTGVWKIGEIRELGYDIYKKEAV